MEPAYREFGPAPALRPFVECFWSMTTRSALEHLVVPDGCIDLIYSPGQGLRAVGAMTTASAFSLPAGARVIGVRFHPGCAGLFLRTPAAELTNNTILLEDIWGIRGRQLQQRLGESAPRHDLAVLAGALTVPANGHDPVRAAIGGMTQSHGAVPVAYLAGQANLSPRQFRRRCLDEAGLNPKQLSRVLRFRKALRRLETVPRFGWAQLALECGYYDQAHFIHEFRALSGHTPAEFVRRQNVHFLQSSLAPEL